MIDFHLIAIDFGLGIMNSSKLSVKLSDTTKSVKTDRNKNCIKLVHKPIKTVLIYQLLFFFRKIILLFYCCKQQIYQCVFLI